MPQQLTKLFLFSLFMGTMVCAQQTTPKSEDDDESATPNAPSSKSFLLAFDQPVDQDDEPAAAPPPERSKEWEFIFAPYLWTMSLRADVDAGPISATVDECFTELAKDLEFAAQARFEGLRDDRWGFFLDGTYLNLGADSRAKVGPFRVRGIGVDVQFTQAWLDFGGMYRFGKRGRSFDLMVGGRYNYLATDTSIAFIDVDDSKDVVAPVVGGRVEYALSDKWLASLKGDVSGFGVDDAADLTWGVTGLLAYRINDRTMLGFGYRYYDIRVGSDFDFQYYGPMVGVAFRF